MMRAPLMNEHDTQPKIIGILKDWFAQQLFRPGHIAVFFNPFYIIRRRLWRGISTLSKQARGRVLDVGCGSKPYAALFSGCEAYVGVDVPVSGHNHKTSKVDVFFDGATLPFADSSHDSVVSFEVLEHVPDLTGMLREIGRVLRPGGVILTTIPFAWDEHEQPYDFRRLTSFGAVREFAAAGFEQIEVTKLGNHVEAIGQLAAAYVWQNLATRQPLVRIFVLAFLIFPITGLTCLLSRLLPQSVSLYCGLAISARRPLQASQ